MLVFFQKNIRPITLRTNNWRETGSRSLWNRTRVVFPTAGFRRCIITSTVCGTGATTFCTPADSYWATSGSTSARTAKLRTESSNWPNRPWWTWLEVAAVVSSAASLLVAALAPATHRTRLATTNGCHGTGDEWLTVQRPRQIRKWTSCRYHPAVRCSSSTSRPTHWPLCPRLPRRPATRPATATARVTEAAVPCRHCPLRRVPRPRWSVVTGSSQTTRPPAVRTAGRPKMWRCGLDTWPGSNRTRAPVDLVARCPIPTISTAKSPTANRPSSTLISCRQ